MTSEGPIQPQPATPQPAAEPQLIQAPPLRMPDLSQTTAAEQEQTGAPITQIGPMRTPGAKQQAPSRQDEKLMLPLKFSPYRDEKDSFQIIVHVNDITFYCIEASNDLLEADETLDERIRTALGLGKENKDDSKENKDDSKENKDDSLAALTPAQRRQVFTMQHEHALRIVKECVRGWSREETFEADRLTNSFCRQLASKIIVSSVSGGGEVEFFRAHSNAA